MYLSTNDLYSYSVLGVHLFSPGMRSLGGGSIESLVLIDTNFVDPLFKWKYASS